MNATKLVPSNLNSLVSSADYQEEFTGKTALTVSKMQL